MLFFNMAKHFITSDRASLWLAKNHALIAKLIELKAAAKAESDRVKAYSQPLLAKYAFKGETLGSQITDVRDLYLVDNDEERVSAFFDELADLNAANGWTGKVGHCPALVAENAALDCELELLPEIAALLGVPAKALRGDVESLKEAVEVVTKLYEATSK